MYFYTFSTRRNSRESTDRPNHAFQQQQQYLQQQPGRFLGSVCPDGNNTDIATTTSETTTVQQQPQQSGGSPNIVKPKNTYTNHAPYAYARVLRDPLEADTVEIAERQVQNSKKMAKNGQNKS